MSDLTLFSTITERTYSRATTVICFLLFSSLLESKEYTYKFQWLSIPVASLIIEFDELSNPSHDSKPHITNFRLSTQGPLRLYREYSSHGYIKYNDDISWDYYLSGNDRGQPEEGVETG